MSQNTAYDTLEFSVDAGVATVLLNRPDEANALTREMAAELFDVAVRCEVDASIRSVLLTGAGKMFCAGGDLKAFTAQGEEIAEYLTYTASALHGAVARFSRMAAPVVVAVNGTAAGGGFSLSLCADYMMVSERAKFVCAYTASGLSPDGSSTYFLAKHVGLLRAKELILTNRVLDADEAVAWGIANKVVAADRLVDEASAMAQQFAQGPTRAYGAVKRLLQTAFDGSIDTQLDAEGRAIVDTMRSDDGRHGLDAFLNKRKPTFSGK
jgi:2-(1,2-epoxy-1,2-dihydrophenyl)acetyl-CoA isomerase